MKKHFIHYPLFRLLSPLFIGSIVYLLILLINNNVEQLQDYFLGQELYVCIGLSYLIQEFSRLFLALFSRIIIPIPFFAKTLLQSILAVLFSIGIVSVSINLYYETFLGFQPNAAELIIFNSIYSSVTLIYISLYLSHQFLYKRNIKKLEEELIKREGIEERYRHFKRGINSQLLFESLESLILLMHKDKDKSDEFIDHLSTVYRYILSQKGHELVSFQEEIIPLQSLLSLFNNLPYRKINFSHTVNTNHSLIPGSLLFIIEQIIRSTISDQHVSLKINMRESEKMFFLQYEPNEKLTAGFQMENLQEMIKNYAIYCDEKPVIEEKGKTKIISIPKIFLTAST